MNHKKKIWLLMVFLLIFGKNSYGEIPKDKAIHCILGEGRLEYSKYGYKALLSLADALRNRGTTKGVYGCDVNFENEISYMKIKGHFLAAEKAWEESKTSDITKGATYWGSTLIDLDWIQRMKKFGYKLTYKIGNQEFYKE